MEAPEAIAAIRELHRQERARRRLVETPSEIGEFMDRMAGALVDAAAELLRVHGLCQPPTAHIICADQDPPYMAALTCRPFRRGSDAAAAVAEMATLPAAMWSTHLVLVWEHSDMCTALDLPGDSFPSGIVVVEASVSEHVLRWHPYQTRFGQPGPSGLPTVDPEWREPKQVRGGWLPDPVLALLSSWRNWSDAEVHDVAPRAEAAGYRIQWVAR